VETVESVAFLRNIGTTQEASIYLKTKMLYTGDIEVTVLDVFTRRSKKFTVDPKLGTRAEITSNIDSALNGFMN
jgi:hypothetical protein